jgi:hypothetical protein
MKIQSANVGAVPTGGEDGELLMVYSLSRKRRDKSLNLMPEHDIRKKYEFSELSKNSKLPSYLNNLTKLT